MAMQPDSLTEQEGDQLPAVVDSLRRILQDQRRINILLTRMVHDQEQRVKVLEARGPSGDGGTDGGAARAAGTLVVGRDVPAYPLSDIQFLRRSEVFGTLSDDALRIIFHYGEVRHYGRGELLFEIGRKADALYVIKEGVVEVARPVDDPSNMKTVAYFTNCDVIGEMRIITQSPHRSIGRVPGGADIFVLRRGPFIDLIGKVPELAVWICQMFAHRLEGTVATLRTHEQRQRQLEGNLEYFDLATVIQTLLSTDQRTGILTVNNDKQETVAELFIDGGALKRARMGKLSGEDAFYQLFQSQLDRGSFFFREDVDPEEEQAEMEAPGVSLLMEAARLQDELSDIKRTVITDPARVYRQLTPNLTWQEEEEKILAEAIWNGVGHSMSVEQIVEQMPRNDHAIYATLAKLVQTNRIG